MAQTARPLQPHNLVYLNRDRGYRFEDRDPDMEWLCDMIDKSGLSIGDIIERVLDASDNQVSVGYGTIANWLSGKTRRPQNFTMTWVSYALGYQRKWTSIE
jgi:hypothetical protein